MFPAVAGFSRADDLRAENLLSIQAALMLDESDKTEIGRRRKGWAVLKWLGRMRAWLFYSLLACPGTYSPRKRHK